MNNKRIKYVPVIASVMAIMMICGCAGKAEKPGASGSATGTEETSPGQEGAGNTGAGNVGTGDATAGNAGSGGAGAGNEGNSAAGSGDAAPGMASSGNAGSGNAENGTAGSDMSAGGKSESNSADGTGKGSGSSASTGAASLDVITYGDELSDSELKAIEKKLNSIGYYGFLRSYFQDPRDIDWNEVFYVGAGFDMGFPPKRIQEEYLKAVGEEELMTDLTTVSRKDLLTYVKVTTGYDYSEMHYPLDWVYLKSQDLYLHEHGDTNQSSVSVTSGYVKDGIYAVLYTDSSGVECCVTFAEDNGMYRFISNLPAWMVLDPTNGGDVDQSAITEGQIFPDSDSRYLTEDDLKGLSAWELRIARNEIYARRGRKFKDSELQAHFSRMDWYFPTVEPEDFDEKTLNEYEKKNLEFIGKYEKDNK